MELQQPKTAADHKCPYLPKKENEDLVLDFRDNALAKIRDIEDLALIGTKLQICPYYASRPAIAPSEMVTLPYPLLLQKSARDALGISLKGHVVITDEAHNLINAIEGIHSSHITATLLTRARESLIVYLQKFRNRLKGANRVYVTQVVRVIDSLLEATSRFKASNETGAEVAPSVLMSGKGVDQINVSKLVRYINDSKLARKVEGYTTYVKEGQQQKNSTSRHTATADTPALTLVQNFLMTLMNPSKEGRFFWAKESDDTALRYLLLDPSEHFREVVEEARAVILAGGTMSPMDEYLQQLFPYISRVKTLSCGHLIPPSNLLVRILTRDQSGSMEFSHKCRSTTYPAIRIATLLLDLAKRVQGGIVLFFPSYDFLTWAMTTLGKGPLQHIEEHKPVFSDDRNKSAEDTFKAYADAVRGEKKGAILLSVLGGKLSEGINFADDLGRCVVVVGLPFPNLHTPEWKAKMEYIDAKAAQRGEPKGTASRAYAENVCMRSVNQAIGRVIRHKDDWASIILMDERYEQERIKSKLPSWIKESVPKADKKASTAHKDVVEDVENFFRERVASR
jgi:chromosome transmission fidelity protein 1